MHEPKEPHRQDPANRLCHANECIDVVPDITFEMDGNKSFTLARRNHQDELACSGLRPIYRLSHRIEPDENLIEKRG